MVQNLDYWRAKECARLQNKTHLIRKVLFVLCLHFPGESCHILLLSNILDFVPCDGSSCKRPIINTIASVYLRAKKCFAANNPFKE